MLSTWRGANGLAPCPYDLHILCKYGVIQVAMLLVTAGILAMLMLIVLEGKQPPNFILTVSRKITRYNLRRRIEKNWRP